MFKAARVGFVHSPTTEQQPPNNNKPNHEMKVTSQRNKAQPQNASPATTKTPTQNTNLKITVHTTKHSTP
jgi:hypothetical protein